MNPSLFEKVTNENFYDPTFLNIDYLFSRVLVFWDWVKAVEPSRMLVLISYLVTLFGITITIYAVVRLIELSNEEFGHLKHAIHDAHEREHARASGKNTRWQHVENLMHTDDSGSWRLAIIEADSILEDALEARGITGDSIGEKLKNSTPGDLASLQAAWDAHQIRNRIAHEGSDYELTARDARRAFQSYEIVLRELGYI